MVRLIPRLIKAAVSNISKKPFTVEYPFKPAVVKEGFRGVQRLDLDKCVGCGLCSIDCPSGAIEMVFYKEARRKVPIFHLDKCVFCYQCAESCRFDAISSTQVFEISTDNKNTLVIAPKPDDVKPLKRPRRGGG